MNNMERRCFLLLISAAPALVAADEVVVRGKLTKSPAGEPAIRSSDGKLTRLTGDEDTVGVLQDARLADSDFEVIGQRAGADTVNINPIHMRALFSYKNGRKLMVTYWCEICAIRTYTPGICWCCREETALDLIEPDKVVKG